jgi:tRNA threonylcarbamoyladenosine modification (KEOPS) complex  Pcc1 subunit
MNRRRNGGKSHTTKTCPPKCRATVEINIDEETAGIIYESLKPETRGLPRADVTLSRNRGKIVLDVAAKDSSALRAALNSYLRWFMVAQSVGCLRGNVKHEARHETSK